jgi:hypothetical protein
MFTYPVHCAACGALPGPVRTQFCFDVLKLALAPGLIDPKPNLTLPGWLDDKEIPYHLEWHTAERQQMSEILYLVHVYRPEDAFLIRIERGELPAEADWREQWEALGIQWYHDIFRYR